MHVNGCEDLPSCIIQRLLQTVDKAFPFASFSFVSSILFAARNLAMKNSNRFFIYVGGRGSEL